MRFFHETDITDLEDCLIFLDIDGTLIHDDSHELDELMIEKAKELQQRNQVYLCSNSPNYERNQKVSEITGITYLKTDLRKPNKKILELVEHAKFERKIVIGDKFLTDGLFAKNIGATFINVKRIRAKKDKIYIKFLYWMDDIASKILKK